MWPDYLKCRAAAPGFSRQADMGFTHQAKPDTSNFADFYCILRRKSLFVNFCDRKSVWDWRTLDTGWINKNEKQIHLKSKLKNVPVSDLLDEEQLFLPIQSNGMRWINQESDIHRLMTFLFFRESCEHQLIWVWNKTKFFKNFAVVYWTLFQFLWFIIM